MKSIKIPWNHLKYQNPKIPKPRELRKFDGKFKMDWSDSMDELDLN